MCCGQARRSAARPWRRCLTAPMRQADWIDGGRHHRGTLSHPRLGDGQRRRDLLRLFEMRPPARRARELFARRADLGGENGVQGDHRPPGPVERGLFSAPLEVVAPDGLCFTATKPAPTGWYYEGTGQASELAWKALAPIVPERGQRGQRQQLVRHRAGRRAGRGARAVGDDRAQHGRLGRHRRARRQLRHQRDHQRRHLQLFPSNCWRRSSRCGSINTG